MGEPIRIKEIDGSQVIRRPWFDIAAECLELLKDLYERDDFRCSMSVDDAKRVQDVLRKGGWL